MDYQEARAKSAEAGMREDGGACRRKESRGAPSGEAFGLALTVESVKDEPGRKGRPCTGLVTIAASSCRHGCLPPLALPWQQTAIAGLSRLHGNAKHTSRGREGRGGWEEGRVLGEVRQAEASSAPAHSTTDSSGRWTWIMGVTEAAPPLTFPFFSLSPQSTLPGFQRKQPRGCYYARLRERGVLGLGSRSEVWDWTTSL